jgi:hypothetical protein
MPFDDTNTLTINAVPADKRSDRGPVLRGKLVLDPADLKRAGWDGETPLKVALWLREGETRDGDPYRFWSGPVEVDEWLQDKNRDRDDNRGRRGSGSRDRHDERKRDGFMPDEDVPF